MERETDVVGVIVQGRGDLRNRNREETIAYMFTSDAWWEKGSLRVFVIRLSVIDPPTLSPGIITPSFIFYFVGHDPRPIIVLFYSRSLSPPPLPGPLPL